MGVSLCECTCTCCLNACSQNTIVCHMHSMSVFVFLLSMGVCWYVYTDYAVLLATCVFSSGRCQRPERRKRRTCCLGACELLIVFKHLYLSRCI